MASDDPILILGAGNRCGSTLVQRLVSSAPGTLVWGEHGGWIRGILDGLEGLEWWDDTLAPSAREAFEQGGYQSFMANLMPGGGAVQAAARAFVERLYAVPAQEMGFARWGFKEVRFGLGEAATLRRLFPGLVAIHITRDPRDMLRSLDRWEREGRWSHEHSANAIDRWADVNESVLAADPLPEWAISWRYEDLLADQDRFVTDVAALIGVAPADLDRSVFEKRIGDYQPSETKSRSYDELPADLRRLLGDDRVRRIATAFRYELP